MILIFTQLEKYQNEYYPDNLISLFLQSYLLAISNVPHFSTEKGPVIISEMTNYWREILAISHDVEFIFPITSLVMFVEENFSQEYTGMDLEAFLIIFEDLSNAKNQTQQSWLFNRALL